MNYKISIIIPVYNVEPFLKECMDSIIRQTSVSGHLEIIMVDDCSTDGSGKIMKDYVAKYPDCKGIFLSKCSGGAGFPRNKGLKAATGKYIMFCDPDDLYFPHTCETMLDHIESYGSDAVYGGFETHSNTGIKETHPSDHTIDKTTLLEYPDILLVQPAVWANIYNRNFLLANDIFFPERIIGEDAFFNFKVLLLAKKISVVPDIIYKYRIRSYDSHPSKMQKIDRLFFKELLESRRKILNLSMKYDYDYFRKRYEEEIYFPVRMLSQANESLTCDDKAKIIKEFYWIYDMGRDYYREICSSPTGMFVDLVLNKKFKEAAEMIPAYTALKEHEERITINQLNKEFVYGK